MRTKAKAEPKQPELKTYIVTDPIKGEVANKRIQAKRGDKLQLTQDEAKAFKNWILEI